MLKDAKQGLRVYIKRKKQKKSMILLYIIVPFEFALDLTELCFKWVFNNLQSKMLSVNVCNFVPPIHRKTLIIPCLNLLCSIFL